MSLRITLLSLFVFIASACSGSSVDMETLAFMLNSGCGGIGCDSLGVYLLDEFGQEVRTSSLGSAVHVRNVRSTGSPYYSPEGPWIVTYIPLDTKSSILASLEACSVVMSSFDFIEEPGQLLSGESSATVFPGVNKDIFCEQEQWHHRLIGYDLLPGELCGSNEQMDGFEHDLDMPQAWAITQGDTSVVVALLDNGFDLYHPEFCGEGPGYAVPDSLPYYNRGVWFRNWNEDIGDGNSDGAPGLAGVDDDGDGLIDEDSIGFEPGNTAESDVTIGTVAATSTYAIYDNTQSWVTDELVGLYVMGNNAEYNGIYGLIVSNSSTEIVCVPVGAFQIIMDNFTEYDGWNYFSHIGATYMVSNRIDDDNDGITDDLGYLDDLDNDDDENGYPDDFHGWDFIDGHGVGRADLVNEDVYVADNDVRGVGDHGTMLASQLATVIDNGRMMGIAPNIKILPIRIGMTWSTGTGVFESLLPPAVDYLLSMGVDVVSTSFGSWGHFNQPDLPADPIVTIGTEAFQRVVDAGIVYTNGAGNNKSTARILWDGVDGSIIVCGVNQRDELWVESAEIGSRYGNWVDIAAPSDDLWCAFPNIRDVPAIENHTWHDGHWGTSLSSPIIAGIAALMKSAYPQYTNNDIRSKMLVSVDNISQYNAVELGGLIGSGRVNAYKALTYYGPVAVTQDTVWTGDVWVSGDIQIPAGNTLTIMPGCTVYLATDDILSCGSDTASVEIKLDGKLIVAGTQGNEVNFTVYGANGKTWGGIVMQGCSELQMSHCVFDTCTTAINQVGVLTTGANPIVLDNVTIYASDCGIKCSSMYDGDYLHVSNTSIYGVDGALYGIKLDALTSTTATSLQIDNGCIIEEFVFPIYSVGVSSVDIEDLSVGDCGTGIAAAGSNAVVTFTDVSVDLAQSVGVFLSDCVATIDGLQVSNAAGIGLWLYYADASFEGQQTVIDSIGINAVRCEGAGGSVLDNMLIGPDCDTAIKVINSTGLDMLDGVNITGADEHAVEVDGGTIDVLGVTICNAETACHVLSGGVFMRDCIISNVVDGISTYIGTGIDCGTVNDYGGNVFSQVSGYYYFNGNAGSTLEAIGNCYNRGLTTPLSSQVLGIGPITLTPGWCQ